MAKVKPRVIKNYEKLDDDFREQILAAFPAGFASEIRTFDIGGGRFMSALPFETEEYSYLIKFPVKEDVDLDEQDNSMAGGDDDDMHLEGGEDVDEEEEDDEVEKPMDNLEELEVADDEV